MLTFFFSPSCFLPFFLCVWMWRRQGSRTCSNSLIFVNRGNSILNVFFLSGAHICYFKCPSGLQRIEKCHLEKPGWATLHQLEKQTLPRGSHHQAQQRGGPRDHSSRSPLPTAHSALCARCLLPKGKNGLSLKEEASALGNVSVSTDCATKPM